MSKCSSESLSNGQYLSAVLKKKSILSRFLLHIHSEALLTALFGFKHTTGTFTKHGTTVLMLKAGATLSKSLAVPQLPVRAIGTHSCQTRLSHHTLIIWRAQGASISLAIPDLTFHPAQRTRAGSGCAIRRVRARLAVMLATCWDWRRSWSLCGHRSSHEPE